MNATPAPTEPAYRRLYWSGLAEGLSFLILLGIAMPLKYIAGKPEYVRVVGSLHGLLFVIYVLMAFAASRAGKWPAKELGLAVIAAVLPFGPFWFDARLKRLSHSQAAR